MNKTIIKRNFLHSLKRGTGEAYLLAKNNPEVDFSNQIIKGALNLYAYDGQSESNRADYIYGLISISKQKEKIRKAILHGLATEEKETWNLTHLFALTKLFAEQNDLEAKQAIYNRFLNNPIDYSDWVGCYEILELDGLNGLLFIAEKFGKYIEQNPGDMQDDDIIEHFQRENPRINAYDALKKASNTNKHIQLYLNNIKQTKKVQEEYKRKRKTIKYKDIIEEVFNSKPSLSFFRKRKLSAKEVDKIAKQLTLEKDTSKIEKLLSIFNFHKFSLNSDLILNFAKQKSTRKNNIVENAIDALKHLKSKKIRAFALEKIKTSKNPIDYLDILISNYQKGDFKLLTDLASTTKNEHIIEQLAGIYSEIYKANKTKECKKPLEALYNKMNCAIHRNRIIEILIENKVLSPRIKEEIKFDSYVETRKLAR
jgi:hypothetical protein